MLISLFQNVSVSFVPKRLVFDIERGYSEAELAEHPDVVKIQLSDGRTDFIYTQDEQGNIIPTSLEEVAKLQGFRASLDVQESRMATEVIMTQAQVAEE
ncbi:MAG: hypothetical protein WC304_04810 [Candidatus Gracilibacteria bacterium]|jgi:hypothetical protein